MKQLYLIYSSDAKWVTRRREEIVDKHLPREMRDENLLEIFSTSGKNIVDLESVLPDILSELGTIPFLPDSSRVVVVHNAAQLLRLGSSKKSAKKGPKKKQEDTPPKKSAVDILSSFVNMDLPSTPNILIFSTIVEYDRGQEIDENSALYQLIFKSPVGQIYKPDFKETNPIFLMSEALLQRDTLNCVRHFRSIYRDDTRGRIFNELLRNIRLLLQAKVLSHVEKKGTSREVISMKYLPNEKNLNLYQQKDFIQDKLRRSMERYTLRELMRAMERLLQINQALYPSKDAAYVPDIKMMIEIFLVEFCEGASTRS